MPDMGCKREEGKMINVVRLSDQWNGSTNSLLFCTELFEPSVVFVAGLR